MTVEGKKVTREYNLQILLDVSGELAAKPLPCNRFRTAAHYLAKQITGEAYADFMTSLLYDEITAVGGAATKL